MRPSPRRPIDAALAYAHRGWPVFPVHSPIRRRGVAQCTCGHLDCTSIGKHPHVPHGLQAATTLDGRIREWWGRWPSAGVAIRTGAPSGLVVVDIDVAHRGEETFQRLVAEHGRLPPVRTVRTGGGGRHLYFAHPGRETTNTAGRLGPGIDTRGDGGYVLVPPSQHLSGNAYRLIANDRSLPELPGWLDDALRPPAVAQPTNRLDASDASAWARAAMEGELACLGRAPEGTRNDTLVRVAFRLGQIVGFGAVTEQELAPLLLAHGVAVGLPEREVTDTVQRGLRAGEAAPRGPAGPEDGAGVVDVVDERTATPNCRWQGLVRSARSG